MRLALCATLLLTVGCGIRAHYRHDGISVATYPHHHHWTYSTSYGSTNIPWSQPATPVNAAPAPNVNSVDIEVTGSDGSYGWQRSCNADVEIHQLSEQMAKHGCTFESYGYDETRAVCSGVHVLLRRDATHIYRLCPPSTDRAVCTNAWAPVTAP
jgi:hypothetical protein